MSAFAARVLSAKPVTCSDSLWIPFVGATWVAVNVTLVGLGTQIAYPLSCAFAAGLINGIVVSVIVVAKASDRFQAGATGLLSGLSLSALRSDGSMIWKATEQMHTFIDGALRGLNIPERLHAELERGTLYMLWTMIFVVLASLVAEWVRSTRAEAAVQ